MYEVKDLEKRKMKKLLLQLGALVTIATPVMIVVSCGKKNTSSDTENKNTSNKLKKDAQIFLDGTFDLAQGDPTSLPTSTSDIHNFKGLFTNQEGVSATFSAITPNTAAGTLDVTVSYTYGTQVATKTFTLTGFQTQTTYDGVEELTHKITAQIFLSRIFDLAQGISTALPTSTYDIHIFKGLFTEQTGAHATFSAITPNTAAGTLDVTVSYTYGTQVATRTFTLTGFQTTVVHENQADLANKATAQTFLDGTFTLAQGDSNSLPTSTSDINAFKELFSDQAGKHATFSSIMPNAAAGTLNVTVSYTYGTQVATKTFTLTGFQTTVVHENQADLANKATAQTFLDGTFTLAQGDSNSLPTSTSDINAFKELFSDQAGKHATFSSIMPNTSAGTLNVTVSYTYGIQVATKTFTLIGFQTQGEHERIEKLAHVVSYGSLSNSGATNMGETMLSRKIAAGLKAVNDVKHATLTGIDPTTERYELGNAITALNSATLANVDELSATALTKAQAYETTIVKANFDKWKDDFKDINGIENIHQGVTNLGEFGNSLTSLPVGFTLPSSVTNLGGFGSSLTSLPDSFTIPSLVINLGQFGILLPSPFVQPTLVAGKVQKWDNTNHVWVVGTQDANGAFIAD